MEISLVLKVAGVGIIVTVICQMLSKAGRDEQAIYVSIAGIIVALMILVGELGELFEMVKDVFGI
ncbi:MAG: stage III sporulation protein AC [Ruminococcaceae bacterium]|nr:stage III sporulation protein AC [Oscillospiraceae bacterium]